MSKFVQRSERSIELPLGCKDLLAVEAICSWTSQDLRTRPEFCRDQLAYCEGFLANLLESAGRSVLVGISVFQGSGHVHVHPGHTGPVVIACWNGAAQQQAIIGAFEEACRQPLGGPLGRWMAKRKNKRSLEYVLPGKPSEGARIVCHVLRTGYGLGDLDKITLWYHAPKNASPGGSRQRRDDIFVPVRPSPPRRA